MAAGLGKFTSAAARDLAAELGIDAESITGTGRADRITLADVRLNAPPPAPEGLGEAGAAFWRAIHHDYGFRVDEDVLLLAICRTIDTLERFEQKLAAASLTVSGSRGQLRPHPLIASTLAHRLALRQLLASLGLAEADAEDAHDGEARSRAGRQLVQQRWSRRRG